MSALAKSPRNDLSNVMMDDDQVQVLGAPPVLDVLSPATRAEIDMQVTTAKRYPRSIGVVKDQALAMATLDEETAGSCTYAVPRAGKTVKGPSVRLAEIMYAAWGNLRVEAKVIAEGHREVVAEGVCWDLEKNNAVRLQITRRITDKNGNRYGDDGIQTTKNAARAIAMREAILKTIPLSLTKIVYRAAMDVAFGDAKTLVEKRSSMVEYFGKLGVKADQVCTAVECATIDDITVDDLVTLKGFANSIRDGDTTIEEVFPVAPKDGDKTEAPKGSKADQLAGKLGATAPAPDEQAAIDKLKARQAENAAATKGEAKGAEADAGPRVPWPAGTKAHEPGYQHKRLLASAGRWTADFPDDAMGNAPEELVARLEAGHGGRPPIPGKSEGMSTIDVAKVTQLYKEAITLVDASPDGWKQYVVPQS